MANPDGKRKLRIEKPIAQAMYKLGYIKIAPGFSAQYMLTPQGIIWMGEQLMKEQAIPPSLPDTPSQGVS